MCSNVKAGAQNKNYFQGMIRIKATLFNVKIIKISPPLHQANYVHCSSGQVNLVFDPNLIEDFAI